MNLAYKYPIIFWNCSCLICDSGGNEEEDTSELELIEPISQNNSAIKDDNDDDEENNDEEIDTNDGQKKKI